MKTGLDHLVIRAPNWVGDIAMATPVLEAALADRRFGRVSIVLRAHLARVLEGGPCEAHVVALGKDDDEVARLRGLGADGILLLSSSLGAAWRAWRARIPLRAGVAAHGRGLLLTHRFTPPRRGGQQAVPTAHVHRDAAGLLGIAVPSLRPRLHFGEAEAEASRATLAELGIGRDEGYVVSCPGAAFGAAKLWPPERFAAALDALFERRGLRGVVTGGPGEEPLMRAVLEAARTPVVSLEDAPRDLHRLKPLIAGAELLLVGDSGPRWYAAAFEVPCVSVMGPNDPALTATSLEWCRVVRVEGLECSPCKQRTCPLEHHRCMRDLTVERVVGEAEGLLERRAEASVTSSGGTGKVGSGGSETVASGGAEKAGSGEVGKAGSDETGP